MELLPEVRLALEPDRIVALVDSAFPDTALAAQQATTLAQSLMPKVTGALAMTLRPISGETYVGIYFPDRRTWFLEQGTRPFTMRSLAGKTIPMWIDDPTGLERAANPRAKTRTTVDGRTQVLIFRRAARQGQRRQAVRRVAGVASLVRVPASYPGAPGRIARRQAAKPLTTAGRTGGQIASGNVGVRWRNPGLVGRRFLNAALSQVVIGSGLDVRVLYLADEASFFSLVRS